MSEAAAADSMCRAVGRKREDVTERKREREGERERERESRKWRVSICGMRRAAHDGVSDWREGREHRRDSYYKEHLEGDRSETLHLMGSNLFGENVGVHSGY